MIKALKNIIIGMVAIGFSTVAIFNIWTQFNTLTEAKRLNSEYRTKISKLESENLLLEKRIAYATSSAYLQQQARDKFGLGDKNDYWLILPDDTGNINLMPTENVADNKPNWKQWLELFTNK